MNVLSLFDGMSCGRIALERAGIKVDNYYSSEIDKYAIQIADKNYPQDTKNRLGNVCDIKSEDLPKIDLLIGGSPCQGFSFAGKQLNFEDERSKLFFEFVRLLKECKPKYFLLENVRMKKEYQDVITNYLGVKPIKINSSLVSAQNRERLYWSNISNIEQPGEKGIVLREILSLDVDKKYILNKQEKIVEKNIFNSFTCITPNGTGSNIKASTIIATYYKRNGNENFGTDPFIRMETDEYEQIRKLTPIECERLQTVPYNYTEGVSNTQRYKMLGNGWTVDVISHIFKGIKNEAN